MEFYMYIFKAASVFWVSLIVYWLQHKSLKLFPFIGIMDFFTDTELNELQPIIDSSIDNI